MSKYKNKSYPAICGLMIGVLLVLAGCNRVMAPTETAPLIIHQIKPSLTDNAISQADVAHFSAINPVDQSRGQLVVFLGGTASSASACQKLLRTVVNLGYHVVSINYPNSTAIGAMAGDDLAKYGKLRQEIVYGTDTSPEVAISPADSIHNRISRLIQYLANTYPAEAWGNYLDNGDLRWEKLILSGYSQGAGHAAFLAQHHAVARVVLFSGVVDGRTQAIYQSADWVATAESAWQTKFAKFRFFVSINDGFYPAITANLVSFGFPPTDPDFAVDIDQSYPLIASKQILLASQATGTSAHPSTCEDSTTPLLANGEARYLAAWKDLFN